MKCYIANYHDQGLIPIKTVAGDKTVNMTIGLDIVRTSPGHGTAFDIAGKNIINPIACILSAAMMLRFSFNMSEEADEIEEAVNQVLNDGIRTADMMSEGMKLVGTQEMGDAILAKI